jgi:hypothetical protein
LTQREFEIKIQAFDESRLMNNLQKIAIRITLGLVLVFNIFWQDIWGPRT